MKRFLKNTRNYKLRSHAEKRKKRLFIKDMPNAKFKKRKNKRILKFLKIFDIKISKNNIIYIYL